MVRKSILITGVSSGLGKAFASELVAGGFFVFGTVRAMQDAEDLKRELSDNFIPVVMDVTSEESVGQALQQISTQCNDLGLYAIVNNSGVHMPGPLAHLSQHDFLQPFLVNTAGPLLVTNTFLPLLKLSSAAGQRPRIINISSFSGKFTIPFTGAYAASKRALDAITDGYRRELMPYKIQVVSVCLGPVDTPIYKKAAGTIDGSKDKLTHTDYAPCMEIAMQAIKNRKKSSTIHVAKTLGRIAKAATPKREYVVGDNLLMNYYMPRYLPSPILDKLFAKRLGLASLKVTLNPNQEDDSRKSEKP